MAFINNLQNFIMNHPAEASIIVSTMTAFPFFIYYVIKKVIPTYRLYKTFRKPKTFEYNLVSIGSEGTPFVTGFIKENPRSKVVVVKSSNSSKVRSDFTPQQVAQSSIDFLSGEPVIISPFEIALNGKIITAENILIATGANSNVPDFPGLEKISFYTPSSIWSLSVAPNRLLILGENQIACEFAQNYHDRGSAVTVATSHPSLLVNEETHVCDYVLKNLSQQKITVLLQAALGKFETTPAGSIAVFDQLGQDLWVQFDVALICLGDVPNTVGIGLEKLEIPLNPDGTIKVDSSLRTNYPTIFACGKAAGISE